MLMLNVPASARPDRARHADRAAAVRARRVSAERHRGDGGGPALLRRRARRLLGRADCIAGVLRARAEPGAGGRQHGVDRGQRLAGLALVRVAGFRGLALGTSIAALANGARCSSCCAAGFAGSTARGSPSRSQGSRWLARHVGGGGGGRQPRLGAPAGTTVIMQSARLLLAMLAAVAALAVSARVLRIPEFDEAVSAVRERVRKVLG